MKKKDSFSVLFEEDSTGVHHNIPNARYEKWEINSLGFRGKEIDTFDGAKPQFLNRG